jgi:hypothetical protein
MLSQRRAAQAWGISRATLQRAVSSGKLSVLPDRTIDPAEMLRVRIPTKPAMHTDMMPATYSDTKPATVPI